MQIRSGQILFQGVLWGVLLGCPALSQVHKGGGKLKCPVGASFGVLNGRAIEMPEPVYPEGAKEKGVTGGVAVFVVVDKGGRVREARACSGPGELRGAAEDAARKARLRPTILSGAAVENRGVLTYVFPPKGQSREPESAPNNGMHPTPLQRASHGGCVGARVMPGVGLL